MLSFFHAPHCTTSTMTSVQEGGRMEERGKGESHYDHFMQKIQNLTFALAFDRITSKKVKRR